MKLLLNNVNDSIHYMIEREKLIPKRVKNIVFVCKGNICRSAFAEYLMKKEFEGKSLSIESCGIEAGEKMSAPLEAINLAKCFGLHMEEHLSKGMEGCNLTGADLIVAMEYWQYRKLLECFPYKKENIRLLREFAPFPENMLCNINDPFGETEEIFGKCFRKIEKSILNMSTIINREG